VDDAFLQWEFRGIISEFDAECPNFFEVDGHWLYLWSPFNNVLASLGVFDLTAYRFMPHWQGRYDWSEFGHSDYYATNHLYAPDRRSILFGWIRGWAPGHGWNGCMGIPREVRVDAQGVLRTPPIEEITALRRALMAEESRIALEDGSRLLGALAGSQYELHCRLSMGSAQAAGFNLCLSPDGSTAHRLWVDRAGVHLDGVHITLSETELAQPVAVRLFMDRSVVELFVDGGRYCAVRVLKDFDPANTGLGLFSQGGQAYFDDLQVWLLRGCDNQG
jgi:sucrose-6-phosphate hydrolase SacC (GH32 family)